MGVGDGGGGWGKKKDVGVEWGEEKMMSSGWCGRVCVNKVEKEK